MGIVQFSDDSGQYEAIMFQEGLDQYRDLLEKGAAVLVTLSGSLEGDEVRARIVAAESLAAAAVRAQSKVATLIATSDPEEALEVADRIFFLDDRGLRPFSEPAADAGFAVTGASQ